jgi:hypothetical protein
MMISQIWSIPSKGNEGELDRLVKRIAELQADLEVVIRFANPNLVEQVRMEGSRRGTPNAVCKSGPG